MTEATTVPRHVAAKAWAQAKAQELVQAMEQTKARPRAAVRHAERAREDRAPDPPNLAHRLRKASGRPEQTIEERMLANAQKAHAKRKPKALTSKGTAPAPPDLATYVRAKRRGLGNAEAMAEARR